MGVKKQKRHRRAVRFYTSCYGFRKPFKVLFDGTFIYNLYVNNMMPADNVLSELLGDSSIKVFTTKCMLEELHCLSRQSRKKNNNDEENVYFQCLKAARNLPLARCEHDKKFILNGASACIKDLIGSNNPQHFFVGTNDTDLRKEFQQIPGVPALFVLRNALMIEHPSEFQRQFAKSSEDQRMHLTEMEYKRLNPVKCKLVTGEEAGAKVADVTCADGGSGNEHLGMQAVVAKKGSLMKNMSVKDGPQFKRKKAKGPNPLSCLKKKNKIPPSIKPVKVSPPPPPPPPQDVPKQEAKDGVDGSVKPSRKRKRTRSSRRGKKLALDPPVDVEEVSPVV